MEASNTVSKMLGKLNFNKNDAKNVLLKQCKFFIHQVSGKCIFLSY